MGKKDSLLSGVTVSLVSKTDTTKIIGAISNHVGKFNIEKVKKGDYILRATYVGFKTLEMYVTVKNKSKDLGILKIEEDAVLMDKVVRNHLLNMRSSNFLKR